MNTVISSAVNMDTFNLIVVILNSRSRYQMFKLEITLFTSKNAYTTTFELLIDYLRLLIQDG